MYLGTIRSLGTIRTLADIRTLGTIRTFETITWNFVQFNVIALHYL